MGSRGRCGNHSSPCVPKVPKLRAKPHGTATVLALFTAEAEARNCRHPKTHQRLSAFPLNVTRCLLDVTFRKSPLPALHIPPKCCSED